MCQRRTLPSNPKFEYFYGYLHFAAVVITVVAAGVIFVAHAVVASVGLTDDAVHADDHLELLEGMAFHMEFEG